MDKHPLPHSDLDTFSKRRRLEDGTLADDQSVVQQSSQNQVQEEEDLCDDCKAVDWSSLPTLAADGIISKSNRKLRSLNAPTEKLKNSSCRICAILSTIKHPNLNRTQCTLQARPLSRQLGYDCFKLSYTLGNKRHSLDNASQYTVLGVRRSEGEMMSEDSCFGRSLAVVRVDDLCARSIVPSSIDYKKLKDLVRICEVMHQKCCAADSQTNVFGLKVIDTRTREVITAPDQCKYLALSYLWGENEGENSVHDMQNSPPVIKDAISVTNSMGYRYLWVDRYCISDHKEKPRMISQMDQIYSNACLTIIAAADGDTEMGLCGVSRPRQPQQQVTIQGVTLFDLSPGHEDLSSSKWASRGWTYQEGYLSTRRLIFTKTQVLFLCNGMFSAEAFQRLLTTNCYFDDTWGFQHLIPPFTDAFYKFEVDNLLRQVQEYSKRELTYSSDSLNAFLGVLRYYANNSAKLTSPVLQLPWGLIANMHSTKRAFNLYFFWHHERPATRRPDFPSWSWAGWGGPVKYWSEMIVLQSGHNIKPNIFSYFEWDISVQCADGKTVKMYDVVWKEFKARTLKNRLYQPGPKQLQITCQVVPVRFQEINLSEHQKTHSTEISIKDTGQFIHVDHNLSDGVYLILQIWEGIYVGRDQANLKLDQPVEKQDCVLGLMFAAQQEYEWRSHCGCLLVRQVGEGLYERVGLLSMGKLCREPQDLLSDMVCLDATGSILEQFVISERERRYPFSDTTESRTICLV